MKSSRLILLMLTVFISGSANGQAAKAPVDRLGVPGPILFDNVSYAFSWSSHPAETYYKQEYIRKGDDADRFKTMILLEVLTGNAKISDLVANKVAELKTMASTNPYITFETFSNTGNGEQLLDFTVTQNAADGKSILIAERNVYRYRTFIDKSGQAAILLFGISVRSYGKDSKPFINSLAATKTQLVNKVRQFTIPAIRLKNN